VNAEFALCARGVPVGAGDIYFVEQSGMRREVAEPRPNVLLLAGPNPQYTP
jgi:hypothetical protein